MQNSIDSAAGVASIDPITLEVVRNKLDGIANEMQSTLLRSSFSTVVKEGLDASASLFTIDGETLSQAIAIPIHLATLIPIVETILRKFYPQDMHEGDIYIMNDPYLGGTHLPDIAIVWPVFHSYRSERRSRLQAWHRILHYSSTLHLPCKVCYKAQVLWLFAGHLADQICPSNPHKYPFHDRLYPGFAESNRDQLQFLRR